MATASLVLGIVGICLFWTLIGGIVLGILAIVFGGIALSRIRQGEPNRGRAVGGIITGIVSLVLLPVLFIVAVTLLGNNAERKFDCVSTQIDQSVAFGAPCP